MMDRFCFIPVELYECYGEVFTFFINLHAFFDSEIKE